VWITFIDSEIDLRYPFPNSPRRGESPCRSKPRLGLPLDDAVGLEIDFLEEKPKDLKMKPIDARNQMTIVFFQRLIGLQSTLANDRHFPSRHF
jgi:hypothetical protein